MAFLAESPLTRLKINVMPSRQINPGVEADLWELAFGPFQQTMPSHLETVALFSDQRRLVVSQVHPLANEIASEPERALAEIPLVVSTWKTRMCVPPSTSYATSSAPSGK